MRYRFDRFVMDIGNRRVTCDGTPIDLNNRYFDALALLVRENGTLVSKDRFLEEVWRGVPVTDEALTQGIKTLRRHLGDDAGRPRFIETVPKHGYRFIAPVESDGAALTEPSPANPWRDFALLGGAGTIGGGLAGFMGGLLYGFGGASQPLQPGLGAVSILLVILCLTILVALIGGAGVAFGIAAARVQTTRAWLPIVGGAVGGLVVGAVSNLLGLDAFNLLLGRTPGDITGAFEGALLGSAVGFGAWLADLHPDRSLGSRVGLAGLAGGAGGVAIVLMGGRLMGGSLDQLARSMPGSRLRLDFIGALVGEDGFGTGGQYLTAGLEGTIFAACIVGAMILARRQFGGDV